MITRIKNPSAMLKVLLAITFSFLFTVNAFAFSSFVVRNIRVIGSQRVSKGTVLNYVPIRVGQRISSANSGKVIRALYETGFFDYVELDRQGSTLVIKVVERATIGSIVVHGNKTIPKDELKKVLKHSGLVQGDVFQKSTLKNLRESLKQEYNNIGKYNARITTKVTPLPRDRVAIDIEISEGVVAKITTIKIIGNKEFKDATLLKQFKLTTSGLFTYFTKKDQYTKQKLDASLEAMRSYYLNRGFIKFRIDSTQVSLTPDKKHVYITIKITEGPRYTFSGFKLTGKLILPREKLRKTVLLKKGDIFSREKVTQSVSAIGNALAEKGYGFPKIEALPSVNEQQKSIFINFSVKPGRHIYVRRISYSGNVKTADYVLRHITKQQEGSLLSVSDVKESERQMRLLGYLKNVDVKTKPVPGTNNQVDLNFGVVEAPSAEATASVGYGTDGPIFSAAFNQHNFMGSGRSVGLNFNASRYSKSYGFSYYNPFYGENLGRGFNLYYQRITPGKLGTTTYTNNKVGGIVTYNQILDDNSSFQYGYGFEHINITSIGQFPNGAGGVGGPLQLATFQAINGHSFNEIKLTTGWNHNTYDRLPFPTEGLNQQVSATLSLPADGNSLTYFKVGYGAHYYHPLVKGFILSLVGQVGYGDSLGNKDGLPFFENYYAGGIAQPGQVRGYSSYNLGPKDSVGNPLGGNFFASGTAELILPHPLSGETFRSSVFLDAGNVYQVGVPNNSAVPAGTVLPAPPYVTGTPTLAPGNGTLRGTSAGTLRYSAGVAVNWRSPFGPLQFSLARPLNQQPGDVSQTFQFTISSGF